MRYSRQDKIIELITTYEIDTQEALAAKLAENGFHVTQATVSRDIKDLKLVKVPSESGKNIYSLPSAPDHRSAYDRYESIFRSTVNSIASSGNIIVLKTVSGCANAAGEAIDAIGSEGILGSIAGDNTIFLVAESEKDVPAITERFREMLLSGSGR